MQSGHLLRSFRRGAELRVSCKARGGVLLAREQVIVSVERTQSIHEARLFLHSCQRVVARVDHLKLLLLAWLLSVDIELIVDW